MYVYNANSNSPYHNLEHLTERCNTDQILKKDRETSEHPPKGRRPCLLCIGKPKDVG